MKSFATMLLVAALATTASAQIAPFVETFDGAGAGSSNCTLAGIGTLPAGWADGGGTSSWTIDGLGTPSSATGPSDDVTGGGFYVYAETSSGCNSGEFILVSPAIDISGLTNPALQFAVNLNGGTLGDLTVEEDDGLGGWTQIAFIPGTNLGDTWFAVEAPITAGLTSTVRFRYSGASSFSGDIAIDNVGWGEVGLPILPPPPPPSAPEFQSNSAESELLADGGIFSNQATGSFFSIDSNSTLVGLPYEIYAQVGSSVGLSAGGLATAGLQTFNLSLNPATTVGVNQLLFGTILPHPGTINFQVFAGSGFTTSAQQLVADPANADGFVLSSAVTIEATFVRGANQVSLSDDGTVNVLLANPVPFMGTLFSDVWINSNANITFGGSDTDFSPSVADALGADARLAAWTDLNPSAGGFISWTEDASGFTAFYDSVPFFGETQGTSLALSVDTAGVATIDLAGFVANPLIGTSSTTGDAVFFGISGGLLTTATDPGPTAFSAGGSGANIAATDMIYNFADTATIAAQATPGLLDDMASLQGAGGLLQFVPGVNAGEYSWVGL